MAVELGLVQEEEYLAVLRGVWVVEWEGAQVEEWEEEAELVSAPYM
jgi:hypothetical protein